MVPFAGNELERSRRSGKMTRIAVVAGDRGSFVSGSWRLALGLRGRYRYGTEPYRYPFLASHDFFRRLFVTLRYLARGLVGVGRVPLAPEGSGAPGGPTPGFRRAGSAAWAGSARWVRRAPDGQVPRAPVGSLASQVADAYGGKGNFPHVRGWVKLPLPLLGGPPRPPSARRAGRPVSPCPRFRVPVVVVRTGGGQWAGGGGGSAWRRP